MKRYAVVVTAVVETALLERARVVAIDEGLPKAASRWLARMRRAVASLHGLPRRAALAEEDGHVAHEVRRLVVVST